MDYTLQQYLKVENVPMIQVSKKLRMPTSTFQARAKKALGKVSLEEIQAIAEIKNNDIKEVVAKMVDLTDNEDMLETSLHDLTILGVKFPDAKSYWDVRNVLTSSIWEGGNVTRDQVTDLRDNAHMSSEEHFQYLVKKMHLNK
ncbi:MULTISPECIES: hypothetical protein [Pediococcus]|uniref:hypothetical protein n=1 Tax=Pediococcus TaxID=1253 RepID=UPI00070E9DC6|nr:MULTISPECIES: hypothetical protein [Pediococcus]AVL00184.1 hypothetical protein PI20285_05760 [Pediococcus inopinatus]KRN61804.1 hypothetical protein IV83_GL000509 [Pediococcus inopinatus]PIO80360.1 hypothetical protein BSQ38_01120 [Pediococcus damnosus]